MRFGPSGEQYYHLRNGEVWTLKMFAHHITLRNGSDTRSFQYDGTFQINSHFDHITLRIRGRTYNVGSTYRARGFGGQSTSRRASHTAWRQEREALRQNTGGRRGPNETSHLQTGSRETIRWGQNTTYLSARTDHNLSRDPELPELGNAAIKGEHDEDTKTDLGTSVSPPTPVKIKEEEDEETNTMFSNPEDSSRVKQETWDAYDNVLSDDRFRLACVRDERPLIKQEDGETEM